MVGKKDRIQAFLVSCFVVPNVMTVGPCGRKLIVGDQNPFVNSQIANNTVGSVTMVNHADEVGSFLYCYCIICASNCMEFGLLVTELWKRGLNFRI